MSVIDRDKSIYEKLSQLRQFARHSIGRFLGTVSSSDSRYKFLIDHAEAKLFIRAEVNALTKLLIDKGVVTQAEWQKRIDDELSLYLKDMKDLWPEVTPAEDGRSFAINAELFARRLREERWPP